MRNKALLLAAGFLACVLTPVFSAEPVSIENKVLRVEVDAGTGRMQVLDKRDNTTYRQGSPTADAHSQPSAAGFRAYGGRGAAATIAPVAVAAVRKTSDHAIEIQLQGNGLKACLVELRDAEPETIFATLSRADGAASGPTDPGFPAPMLMDGPNACVMQSTQGDGILLPLNQLANAKGAPFSFGNALPIYGLTDMKKGCVAVLETWRHKSLTDNAAYPEKIRYHFVTNGGYVALARYYRGIVQQRGDLITLREKAKITPQVNDITGAPVIYLWGHARTYEFCKTLKDSGIQQALIMMNLRAPIWPDKDSIMKMRSLGYVVGRYVLGTNTEPSIIEGDWRGGSHTPASRATTQPGAASQGAIAQAGTAANQPANPLELIKQDLEQRPFQSRFFDTFVPQIRGGEEKAKDAVTFFKTVAKEYHQMPWSGEGYTPDWAFPGLVGVEGSMSMRTYVSGKTNSPATRPGGGEDWINRYIPAAVVGDVTPDQTFWDWQVNPAVRIPLVELVYHDCLFTTWNWRNANHRFIGGWTDQDLMNILFGNKPMWCLDVGYWEKNVDFRQKLVDSYKKFSPVLQQVALEDMVDHRWLSDDKKVAMTDYANGVHVAVNFKTEPFVYEGKTIAAKSFITWKD